MASLIETVIDSLRASDAASIHHTDEELLAFLDLDSFGLANIEGGWCEVDMNTIDFSKFVDDETRTSDETAIFKFDDYVALRVISGQPNAFNPNSKWFVFEPADSGSH